MKFSLYSMAIDTFVPMLRTRSTLLDKAATHALDKKLDFAELAQARLAADMYPLSNPSATCPQPIQTATAPTRPSTRHTLGKNVSSVSEV